MKRRLVATLLATSLATAACGGGADHGDADVAFAQDMIPHHAQAIAMANLTIGREGVDPEVADLAEQIRLEQQPEIDTLAGWLKDWEEKVPQTGFGSGEGHTHSEEGMGLEGMEGMEGDGMMSADDLRALQDARGAEFSQRWLEMMIEHHEGAVAMAEKQVENGDFPAAVDLAEDMVRSQTAEIETMRFLAQQ